MVGGHRISSFVTTITSLKTNSRYILFLKYIPESQSYKKVDLEGYDITNPTVLPLHKGVVNSLKEQMEDRDAVINAVVSSSAKVALNYEHTLFSLFACDKAADHTYQNCSP
jgi:hypothetical protein